MQNYINNWKDHACNSDGRYLYKEDVYSSAVDIDLPEELPERNMN